MNIVMILAEAWRAMGQNRLRTGLTMLGMIIGVGAVVVMLGVGQGARTTVNESIKSIGSNLFIVLSGASTSGGLRMGAGTVPTLTVDDALGLATLDSVKGAAPVLPGTVQMSYGANNWSTLVYAVTPDYLTIRDWVLESGQTFSDADVRGATRVAILGKTVVKNLFGDEDPIGKTLRIKGSPFQVVGVRATRPKSGWPRSGRQCLDTGDHRSAQSVRRSISRHRALHYGSGQVRTVDAGCRTGDQPASACASSLVCGA